MLLQKSILKINNLKSVNDTFFLGLQQLRYFLKRPAYIIISNSEADSNFQYFQEAPGRGMSAIQFCNSFTNILFQQDWSGNFRGKDTSFMNYDVNANHPTFRSAKAFFL